MLNDRVLDKHPFQAAASFHPDAQVSLLWPFPGPNGRHCFIMAAQVFVHPTGRGFTPDRAFGPSLFFFSRILAFNYFPNNNDTLIFSFHDRSVIFLHFYSRCNEILKAEIESIRRFLKSFEVLIDDKPDLYQLFDICEDCLKIENC